MLTNIELQALTASDLHAELVKNSKYVKYALVNFNRTDREDFLDQYEALSERSEYIRDLMNR